MLVEKNAGQFLTGACAETPTHRYARFAVIRTFQTNYG